MEGGGVFSAPFCFSARHWDGSGADEQGYRILAAAFVSTNNTYMFSLGVPFLCGSCIAEPPGFVNPALGDYRIQALSALRGAGNAATTTRDFEGYPRDTWPAIGADEYGDYNGRVVGDFDGDLCTGINDFLFLLDNWALDVDGTVVGIEDFLALLESWNIGPGC